MPKNMSMSVKIEMETEMENGNPGREVVRIGAEEFNRLPRIE